MRNFPILLLLALSWSNLCGSVHWAFQPISKPVIPEVANQDWPRNSIDHFILAKLEQQGIPAPRPAKEAVLKRRIAFDLVGLPPDNTALKNTLHQQVEALLASPHYGERWGRHWLDVARYADSNGLDENAAHANAWRYRDYVVQSFNEDKPFNRFLTEQIAGDLLPDNGNPIQRRTHLIATGFLSMGPKVLAEPDMEKLEMDIIDEQIDTLGQAFLGLTLGCARCHEHKFDPVPMKDYYALAGIFKSTITMESLKRMARWKENTIASPGETKLAAKHNALVDAQNKLITAFREKENQVLLNTGKLKKLPKKPEAHYPEPTRKKLEKLLADLKTLEESKPKLDSAMGVVDGKITNLPILLRGDTEMRGEVQPRGFLSVLKIPDARLPGEKSSGRLELANWMTSPNNPLTARVIVNRVWHWHFGRGLVETPDNFGLLGQKPSHPALLDWLTTKFIEDQWSIKKLHRLILDSATWQMSSSAQPDAVKRDPHNQFHSRAPIRRIEAEVLRDALLRISDQLDTSVGGSTWKFENRKLVFNHTSEDKTNYQVNRRSLYLPVIRNHVYDLFQLFDFPDPNMMKGNRSRTTTAQQALYMMNSPLVMETAKKLAIDNADGDPETRIHRLYNQIYQRPAQKGEIEAIRNFIDTFTADASPQERFQALAQSLICANEFIFLK
jgi:hypothetical protein